jgi:hypothetical protein
LVVQRVGQLAKGCRPARLERRESRQYEIGAPAVMPASASCQVPAKPEWRDKR